MTRGGRDRRKARPVPIVYGIHCVSEGPVEGREISDPRTSARSSRADVRNPLLRLGAMRTLVATTDPGTLRRLASMLRDLAFDANDRAQRSWRKGKAPMAAYWKAVSVYAKHTAHAIQSPSWRSA